uniref:IS1 family transposase n=1 Tax=Tenacibaculum sediminilitoris TaxID=1820334 RepID=UPI0038B69AB1
MNMYSSIIPKEIHRIFQYCANSIERINLNLRTHIKRLSKKTICFTRKKIFRSPFKIYF